MCTFNGAAYLPAQLASIAAQTRPPDELVICDDGSTDATHELLTEFAARAHMPVRIHVNERNVGAVKNFARAIELCTGDIIALCDQDDIWRADKLRRTEAVLAANPQVGLVFTNAEIVDEHTRPLGHHIWECVRFTPERQRLFTRGHAFALLLEHTFVTGATLCFRAAFKELVLPIPTDLVIIHDAWIARMISAAAELAMIGEPLVQYRWHDTQQIGVPLPPNGTKPTWPAALRAGLRRRVAFDASLHDLSVTWERLNARADAYHFKAGVRSSLGARIAHLQTRARLPANRLRRLPLALRELLSLRYHAYSNGLLSVAKDLLC
jgi:glycosyltransferase involved in cell wall biosynthesis